MDFISTYVPAFVELTSDEIADCRDRLEAFSRTMFPELDTSPNTVLGDLILTPQAYQIAALEKGMDRFMSDLNLGNVAAGTIYNCDFVTEYLKNFAVNTITNLRSSGVIRMVFSRDKEYTLDRSTQFKFGEHIFSIYLPNLGNFEIKRVGDFVEDGINGTCLKDSGADAFFADIPVVGHDLSVTVQAGSSGLISTSAIPELGSITALVDFLPGTKEYSVSELAESTRKTIYAASMNTREGADRFLNDVCPFVDSCYAIISSDKEMLRDKRENPFGAASGKMDLYVRSAEYNFTETQSVRLVYNAFKKVYEGYFDYVGQPYYIDSVTHTALPNVANIEHTVVAVNTHGLGPIGAYTAYEKLYLIVPDQTTNGDSVFRPDVDATGAKYATFEVTYRTDPLFPAINTAVNNPDYKAINTDVLVKGFIPVIISKFNVQYTKKSGAVPDLKTAEAEIRSYIDGLGAPDAYSDAVIAKIMREAGVSYVVKTDVLANVQWTLGDYISSYGDTQLDTARQSALNGADANKAKSDTAITTSAGLRIKYPADGVLADEYACSIRNVRYYMLDTAVTFTEIEEM